VPSQSELLYDLGLEESIVGITKFCVHPQHLKATKTIVGGTKNVKFEKIKALSPDIIICNKEENTLEMVEMLRRTEIPVPTELSYQIFFSFLKAIVKAN
jgi:ABC-type hemin transport system substrate-binding protein